MIKWEEVTGKNFELFMYYTMGRYNFKNREWHGEGGSDKGRDIVAFTYEELPFKLGYERKWIVQCKKRKSAPNITEISNDLITASQHKPDFWVLAITLNPTSNFIDNIHNIAKQYLQGAKHRIITLAEIEEMCHENPDLVNVLYYGTLKKEGDE
ncbi:restriction endonuclease [Bacillus cereus]|uniref:restriction endonuclease n=1 Tax=Bacillus cereus TaxID=1396 RepID=UPI0021B20A68|nr:restriction endonuclease [Bacillus cereus]